MNGCEIQSGQSVVVLLVEIENSTTFSLEVVSPDRSRLCTYTLSISRSKEGHGK
jgi:hypothetical protein